MPKTAQTPSHEYDRDQTSSWITLASMFVLHGQSLEVLIGYSRRAIGPR